MPSTQGDFQISEHGFVVLPQVFAFDEIAWVRDEARVVALRRRPRGRVAGDEPWANEAPDGTIYGAHLSEPAFRKLAAHPRILEAARQQLGDDVYIHQSRLVPRFAESPSDVSWRRDFATWSAVDGMPTPRALTAAIVLGECGPRGSVLHVVPGSHRAGSLGETSGLVDSLSAPLGSVIIYHSNLAYAFNRPGDRQSPPLYLVSYNAVGNAALAARRDEIYAARRAVPPVPEADDCMWPASWCAAG